MVSRPRATSAGPTGSRPATVGATVAPFQSLNAQV